MNKTGTEYVRGIPVVKVFQQTVYSLQAPSTTRSRSLRRHGAGATRARGARGPQVTHRSPRINGRRGHSCVPAAIARWRPGEGDFARFLANFAFYAIFSAGDSDGHDHA